MRDVAPVIVAHVKEALYASGRTGGQRCNTSLAIRGMLDQGLLQVYGDVVPNPYLGPLKDVVAAYFVASWVRR